MIPASMQNDHGRKIYRTLKGLAARAVDDRADMAPPTQAEQDAAANWLRRLLQSEKDTLARDLFPSAALNGFPSPLIFDLLMQMEGVIVGWSTTADDLAYRLLTVTELPRPA
ncbi:hypothetical protein FF36_01878 [Frankia torreyi]|uniref:Uncharacterized protein n=1 Tax=Frankia torreyi TaxID=1856 RepID=A0A0D8BHD6_9ACTN|nr:MULTISPECIES: hypothetical protein [Frankia]KJE23693.1 hypothetical protein FF36_01878 [Frankia torreyi]